jgi:hypothetical protein
MQEVVGLSPIVSTKENTGHFYDRYFLYGLGYECSGFFSSRLALSKPWWRS